MGYPPRRRRGGSRPYLAINQQTRALQEHTSTFDKDQESNTCQTGDGDPLMPRAILCWYDIDGLPLFAQAEENRLCVTGSLGGLSHIGT